MAAIATLATVMSAAASAVGTITTVMQMQYQAEVAKMNQEIASENAIRALHRADIEAQDQDMLTLGALSDQLGAQSASGLDINSRSTALTRKTSRELGRRDALNVKQAGEIEAYNYRTQAANFAAEAQASRLGARGAALGGFLGLGGSLLGNARSTKKRMFPAAPTQTPVYYGGLA